MPTDDLPIFRRNPQFQHCGIALVNLGNRYRIGIVHYILYDVEKQFFINVTSVGGNLTMAINPPL